MRILQIFNQYRFRGGEEAWVEEIPRLLDGVAEVEELRFRSDDWVGRGAPSVWRQVRLMGDNPEARRQLRERVREFRPDLLLFHNVIPVASFGLYEEARILGLPVLQYIHNFRPFSPGGTLWVGNKVNPVALQGNPWPEILAGSWQGSVLKTAVLAWHLKLARRRGVFDVIHRWIAPSCFMYNKFLDSGIPREKLTVIQHCWDSEDMPVVAAEGGHYLYLGRFVPEKGVRELVLAWVRLEKGMGKACPELILAGSGPEEPVLKEFAKGSKKIVFAGFVRCEEKNRLLREARALLVPSSWWEPLGLTAFESYASGRPVIAARAGALQETVIDGVTGWTHEPGDVESLVQAIAAAERAGPEERGKRGASGKAWLRENANPEDWRRKFLAVCGAVVEGAKGKPRDAGCRADDGKYAVFINQHTTNNSRQSTPPRLALSVYLADQNPGVGRSLGISRMSEIVLSALAERQEVALSVLVSKSSQQGPGRVASRQELPWGTRRAWQRLLTDHFHPLFQRNGRQGVISYYPKGFLPLSAGLCRPVVVTVHDTIIEHCRRHYPSWRRSVEYAYWAGMLKHALRAADRILTVSQTSKRQIEEFMRTYGIPAKEITVTYEPCLYESIPQPDPVDKGNYVLHLASREPHKRTAQLVRWWLESAPASLPTLRLIGRLPPEVEGFAKDSPYVMVRPFLDDAELRAEISGARALILPSEIEGFGLPALEAYYLGTPVCYSRGTSVEEVLWPATHKGGFDLEDVASLFQALNDVMGMSSAEIRACGLKLRECYASSRVVETMLRVFREEQGKSGKLKS